MRIPFEISKRPQIESGEYKVIYVEYPSTNQYPVEILKWDSNSDAGCIIGCVRRNGKDRIYAFDENGEHKVSGEDDRLFIVTPEPEMSEFEQAVANTLFDWQGVEPENRIMTDSVESAVKEEAAKLLDLAKQQLLQSGELMTQEHHEKLMETQYKETLDGVKKNWHDYFTPQAVTDIYNAGRNDILKDMPRWRNVEADKTYVGCVARYMDVNGDWNYCMSSGKLSDDCQYISIATLEKLPMEDESHE